MAHLVLPRSQSWPVQFNVHGAVGAPPASNKREDVLLVQLAMAVQHQRLGASERADDPDLARAIASVRVTGTVDEPTIAAIRQYQLSQKRDTPGTIVDGRVSPLTGDLVGYGRGRRSSPFTLVTLNETLMLAARDDWPRIDKIPGCPAELKQVVNRIMRGVW